MPWVAVASPATKKLMESVAGSVGPAESRTLAGSSDRTCTVIPPSGAGGSKVTTGCGQAAVAVHCNPDPMWSLIPSQFTPTTLRLAGSTSTTAAPVSGEVAVIVVVQPPGGTPVTTTFVPIWPSRMVFSVASSVTHPSSFTDSVTCMPPGGATVGAPW